MTYPDESRAIVEDLASRGVARLLHFTPAQNLPGILTDRRLRSVEDMTRDERSTFARTDLARLDDHQDKISCSLEFPNSFYRSRASNRGSAVNFRDWAFVVVEPAVAATPGTLFSPCNAASGNGKFLKPGIDGLKLCYERQVSVAQGSTRSRASNHHPAAPTDVQAEVLVPGPIEWTNLREIICPTPEKVRQERARLRQVGIDPDLLPWGSSPALFTYEGSSDHARGGHRIDVIRWTPEKSSR